ATGPGLAGALARRLDVPTGPPYAPPVRAASHIPFARTGAYPLRAGNRVRPLVDGEPAFRRICAAIDAARARVWATVAFVEPDMRLPDEYGTLFDVLERAERRGLDVRVLFW